MLTMSAPMNANATLPERSAFPWFGLFIAMAAVVLGILFYVNMPREQSLTEKRAVARNDVMTLVAAIKNHIAEYGASPIGDNAHIMAALRGTNARQIVFFEMDADRINALGEFFDPWGHPYRIDASNPEFVWVYSFGKNGIDEGGAEGSDDIASWR